MFAELVNMQFIGSKMPDAKALMVDGKKWNTISPSADFI